MTGIEPVASALATPRSNQPELHPRSLAPAETSGFEPPRTHGTRPTRFPDGRIEPLCHVSLVPGRKREDSNRVFSPTYWLSLCRDGVPGFYR
jgi:hypothetical protein